MFKETQGKNIEIYSYDMRPIEPLHEDDEDVDEQNGLVDEKPPREIGIFIKHEDFNPEGNFGEDDEQLREYQSLSATQQVFVMDHDFVCISKQEQAHPEYRDFFLNGSECYEKGDWG